MGWQENKRQSQLYCRNVLLRSAVTGFRAPLRIVPEVTFLERMATAFASSQSPTSLKALLEELLGCQCKLFTTSCILQNLRARCKAIDSTDVATQSRLSRALDIAKGECEILRHCCGNAGHSSPLECVQRATANGNSLHYVVGTQEWSMFAPFNAKSKAPSLVPIVYVDNGNHVNVRRDAALEAHVTSRSLHASMHVTAQEKELLERIAPVAHEPRKKLKPKVRKPTNPNPLSMKKKKPKNKQ